MCDPVPHGTEARGDEVIPALSAVPLFRHETGIEQDAKAAYEVATRVANTDNWPAWYKGNEFKAIREASLKGQ